MNLMQLPDERNSKRQISDEKEQKKNGHKKYNLFLLPSVVIIKGTYAQPRGLHGEVNIIVLTSRVWSLS